MNRHEYEQGRAWALNREPYTESEWAVIEATVAWAEAEGLDEISSYHAGLLSTRAGTVDTGDGTLLAYGE